MICVDCIFLRLEDSLTSYYCSFDGSVVFDPFVDSSDNSHCFDGRNL